MRLTGPLADSLLDNKLYWSAKKCGTMSAGLCASVAASEAQKTEMGETLPSQSSWN